MHTNTFIHLYKIRSNSTHLHKQWSIIIIVWKFTIDRDNCQTLNRRELLNERDKSICFCCNVFSFRLRLIESTNGATQATKYFVWWTVNIEIRQHIYSQYNSRTKQFQKRLNKKISTKFKKMEIIHPK